MPNKLKLNLLVALVIIFWASAYVGIREGLKGYSPGSLALFRFSIASICMLIIYLKNSAALKLTPKQFMQTFALGIIGFSIYHFFLNTGELTVQAGTASFIISQIPVLITIFAMLFLGDRLNLWGWVGTITSIFGLVLITFGSELNAHFDCGIIYIGIAAIAGSLHTAFQKPLLKHISPITFTTYSIWAGNFCLLFFLPNLFHEIPQAPWSATLAVIYIGIFPAAIAYLLWSFALKHYSALKLGSTLYIVPIGTMILGWIFLDEAPTWIAISGGMLALLGAFLVSRGVISKNQL